LLGEVGGQTRHGLLGIALGETRHELLGISWEATGGEGRRGLLGLGWRLGGLLGLSLWLRLRRGKLLGLGMGLGLGRGPARKECKALGDLGAFIAWKASEEQCRERHLPCIRSNPGSMQREWVRCQLTPFRPN
jgi:hypothetical protein